MLPATLRISGMLTGLRFSGTQVSVTTLNGEHALATVHGHDGLGNERHAHHVGADPAQEAVLGGGLEVGARRPRRTPHAGAASLGLGARARPARSARRE